MDSQFYSLLVLVNQRSMILVVYLFLFAAYKLIFLSCTIILVYDVEFCNISATIVIYSFLESFDALVPRNTLVFVFLAKSFSESHERSLYIQSFNVL